MREEGEGNKEGRERDKERGTGGKGKEEKRGKGRGSPQKYLGLKPALVESTTECRVHARISRRYSRWPCRYCPC